MALLLRLPYMIFHTSNSLNITQTSQPFPMKQHQKQTHLHFYFHDILSGRNPTTVKVVGQDYPNSTFGTVMMADDPLTDGPDRSSSKLIGRAQGMYAWAGHEVDFGFLMVMNLVFFEGEFNGSVLSLLGRNKLGPEREMPIVGGTGVFRFATGYALGKPYWLDYAKGDATVEYDVFVLHY
ncbi:hypothetical protein QJS10_CPB13g00731 [Acorus calamus]|uniref:Dirigent protein n=1 Tax=Acorus calamus TaxID=4465 RepID=A0AAV9DJQ6_ACOCL|nr:hypothetical protein QJS10_CPB13g00731 [Acorus calamus]